MKTFKERMEGLTGLDKHVAIRLMENIVVMLPICSDHRIDTAEKSDTDNTTETKYDALGIIIYTQICSDTSLLAGILKYESSQEVLNEIFNAM